MWLASQAQLTSEDDTGCVSEALAAAAAANDEIAELVIDENDAEEFEFVDSVTAECGMSPETMQQPPLVSGTDDSADAADKQLWIVVKCRLSPSPGNNLYCVCVLLQSNFLHTN